MGMKAVEAYYQESKYAEIRPELKYALGLLTGAGTAIDCGCGAGSNIAHLRAEDYTVHAFDIDEEAISLCSERFANDSHVHLYLDSFGSFNYPKADLVVADASLFFCPAVEFEAFIEKLFRALQPKGVFCGAFLGARDSMASPEFNSELYWGDVLVLTEAQIKYALKGFDILQCKELELDGKTNTGESHHWHIFTIVARVHSG